MMPACQLHAVKGHDAYLLARAMKLQAGLWHKQRRFEEAKSEASRAVDEFERLGAADGAEDARELLRQIDRDANRPHDDGELTAVLLVVFIDLLGSERSPNPNDGTSACLGSLDVL
jgi:hypothetical protein